MTGSSGFKIVAVVAVLSVGAVMVIDKFIEDGAFTSLSVFSRRNEAAPESAVSKPADKKDVPSGGRTAKRATVTTPDVNPATSADDPRAIVEVPIGSNEGRQAITPGMSRAQISKLFGEPTLRVIETRNRKVVERWIYVNAGGYSKTVAILENGKAVRWYTAPHFEVKRER